MQDWNADGLYQPYKNQSADCKDLLVRLSNCDWLTFGVKPVKYLSYPGTYLHTYLHTLDRTCTGGGL